MLGSDILVHELLLILTLAFSLRLPLLLVACAHCSRTHSSYSVAAAQHTRCSYHHQVLVALQSSVRGFISGSGSGSFCSTTPSISSCTESMPKIGLTEEA